MRTPWIWSVSLGRWWGVHLRLHLFFFLFAALLTYVATIVNVLHYSPVDPQTAVAPNGLVLICPLALLLSVLLHEIGHVVVARHLGGVADEIVLSPLGGLAPVRVPYEPHSELVACMAGTLVNAAICCFCAALLVARGEQAAVSSLVAMDINFFHGGEAFDVTNVIRLVFWLNWSLILVNLLPVFPFDGGRSLHAVLSFLWPELDSNQASLSIIRLGKVVALLLLVVAFQFSPAKDFHQPPVWLALSLLAIYVFFCSRLEELLLAEAEHHEDTVFGYDFSQGYTSFEQSIERSMATEEEPPPKQPKSPVRFIRSWLEQRKARQEQRLREQETEDERRVDEILAQLHEGGMKSLSAEDRALLERVSKRYRSRPT